MQENLEKLKFLVSLTICNRAAEILCDIQGSVDAGLTQFPDVVQPVEEVVDNVNLAAGLIKELLHYDDSANKWQHVMCFPHPGSSIAATDPTPSEPSSRSSSITATSRFDDVKNIIKEEHDQRVTVAKKLFSHEKVRSLRAGQVHAVSGSS
jgi:hypothetical protein